MDVKVVPFILFALAWECLSLLDESPINSQKHDHQVLMVLEKIFDKITSFCKRLSSIDKRAFMLEKSQTPMETNATAYRSLQQTASKFKEYTMVSKKHCEDDKYGSYSTLGQAHFACEADNNCDGIYDNACNGPPYHLCPLGADWKDSLFGLSCIYEKPAGKISKCRMDDSNSYR